MEVLLQSQLVRIEGTAAQPSLRCACERMIKVGGGFSAESLSNTVCKQERGRVDSGSAMASSMKDGMMGGQMMFLLVDR